VGGPAHQDGLTVDDWFCVTELAEGVWQLTEPGHVCCWLVAGAERAALIDTGCGFAPIRPVVEALTDRPVTVVHTHHHFDHVGGDREFEDVLIHPLGVAGLAAAPPRALLDAYLTYATAQEETFGHYRRLDQRFFHLLEDCHRVRRLSDETLAAWQIDGVTATGEIEAGDVIDLGGRALEVLHTPGHSPDCVCLDLVGEGLLFGGDTVNTGPVYAQLPASDLVALQASLAMLAARAGTWSRVFCSHFMRTEVAPAFLARQAAAFARVLAGEVPLRPAEDCTGTTVREAVFDGFSVFLPEERAATEVAA
jgi:glyoxylase-like metal-dependent hydrolase (beta-lactamase superfamily II)